MNGSRGQKIAGWVLSIIIALFLMGPSALGKFLEWEGKADMLEHLGFSAEVLTKIGILEVALALLFLVPRASFIGAILLTGYLGGAVVTHVRVGDPFFMPIVMGVILWIGLALREPAIWRLGLGLSPGNKV